MKLPTTIAIARVLIADWGRATHEHSRGKCRPIMIALARIWLESWYSTGLKSLFDPGLEMLRKRIPDEVAKGWSLYAAEEDGKIVGYARAAAAAISISTSFGWRPRIRAAASAAPCWPLRVSSSPTKSGCAVWSRMQAPGAGMSARAFRFEDEEIVPPSNMRMKRYRWKRELTISFRRYALDGGVQHLAADFGKPVHIHNQLERDADLGLA